MVIYVNEKQAQYLGVGDVTDMSASRCHFNLSLEDFYCMILLQISHISYRKLSQRLQYIQYISNGDTAVLH